MIILNKEKISLSSKDCKIFEELFTKFKNKVSDDYVEGFQKSIRIILGGLVLKAFCSEDQFCFISSENLFKITEGFLNGFKPDLISDEEPDLSGLDIIINSKSGEIVAVKSTGEAYLNSNLIMILSDIRVNI